MRLRPIVSVIVALSALAACGNFLGDEDSVPTPERPPNEGGPLGGEDGAADGASDGPPASADAGACSADGLLEADPSFGDVSVGLVGAKWALSSADGVVGVGRCSDGGGLEMTRVSADGGRADVPGCFGGAMTENVVSVARTSAGYVVASSALSGQFLARVTHASATGSVIGSETLGTVSGYSASYAKFALEVSGTIVWGGYRYAQVGPPDRGFIKVMSKVPIELDAGEVPVSAASSGTRLYVALARETDGGVACEIAVRRYEVQGGNLVADTTFDGGTPPTVSAMHGSFDGLGSILVDGDVVTVAAQQGNATVLLRLQDGTWSQEVISAIGPIHLARSCDTSLLAAGAMYLDASTKTAAGIVRRAGGAPSGELALPDENTPVSGLLRANEGDLYVTQGAGAVNFVRRVTP